MDSLAERVDSIVHAIRSRATNKAERTGDGQLTSESNLEAALRLVREGWIVFPCKPEKTPYVKFLDVSARNEAVVTAWFEKWPDALPALPCGANGLCVVDGDCKDAGVDGVANFHAGCAASSINLSGCFAVDTPSGGRHYYFQAGAGYRLGNTVSKLAAGVDTRGAGGYVIAPGAALPDGRAYRPVQGALRGTTALPAVLAEFLAKPDMPEPITADFSLVTNNDRVYATSALQDEYNKLCATTCNRNNALNNAALALGTLVANGSLNEADAVSMLLQGMNMNGYTSQKPDGTKRAVATIYSGLTSGKAKPRPLPSQTVPPLNPALQASIEAKGRAKAVPQPSPTKRSVKLLRGSEIETRNVEWLWKGFLPLGMIV